MEKKACPACGRDVGMRSSGVPYPHKDGDDYCSGRAPEDVEETNPTAEASEPDPPVAAAAPPAGPEPMTTFRMTARWRDGQHHHEPNWRSENARLCAVRAQAAGLVPVGEARVADEWDSGPWHFSIYEIEVE